MLSCLNISNMPATCPRHHHNHNLHLLLFFFFFFFFFIAIFFFSATTATNTTTAELNALLQLKSSLKARDDLFSSWVPNASSPCSFTGITCDETGTTVIEIDLSNRGLSYQKQKQKQKQNQLPLSQLCINLPSLQKLALGFNSLSGQIPDSALSSCHSLRYLDLGNNGFSGDFPSSIGGVSSLEHLYLNLSGFTGKFPWDSIYKLPNLQTLSVGDNSFNITPGFPAGITNLSNLTWLYMSNCSISGSIPATIGNLTRLINLELSDNHLTGQIPHQISNLNNLWQLELYDNMLHGTIPAGFRNLTNLRFFDASNNLLHGDISELRHLTRLVSLQLFQNNFTGQLPPEFGHFNSLTALSLYTNGFTGSLPQNLGSSSAFELIDISTNYFTGTIPPNMCKQGKMLKLLLLQNNFTGGIPQTYASCPTLLRFRVSQNLLAGLVPAGIWGLPNAEIIDIADNTLQGSITDDIAGAHKLGTILAANNKLSGRLPDEISAASSLVKVDLRNNRLSGPLPDAIGKLSKLSTLYLDKNSLSDTIPDSLGSCSRLTDLNLAHNSLSGQLPPSIGSSLTSLYSLNLSHNHLSGQVPHTFGSLKLSLLDLSYNNLTGPIPDSLSIEAFNNSFVGNPGLCTPKGGNLLMRPCSAPHNSSSGYMIRTYVICFVVGSVVLILLTGYYAYLKLRGRKDHADQQALPPSLLSLRKDYTSWDMKSYHVLSFTEDEILDSIKEDNLIGKGGSGNVYKVTLKDGKALAVKHIWTAAAAGFPFRSDSEKTHYSRSRRRRSKEFDMEVKMLSSIRHVSVVKLFCSITSDDSSLLVYEYLPNGSLWDQLHTSNNNNKNKLGALDWPTRHQIALGAARGLDYLHHGCERPVIHRDIKSSNILLDDLFKPKIADFGLAKVTTAPSAGGKDSTHVVAGTHGYIAPEYGYTYKVNEKSDVYSFGVVLMELVTGKRPMEPEFGESKDIVSWVSSNLTSRETVLSLVDPCIIPESLKEEAIKVLKIAILCTARHPEARPTMRRLVQMLEDAEPCKLVTIEVVAQDLTKKG